MTGAHRAGVPVESTAEQDRRQIELHAARADRDEALALSEEVLRAVTTPGAAIPSSRMRSWRERHKVLEVRAGRRTG